VLYSLGAPGSAFGSVFGFGMVHGEAVVVRAGAILEEPEQAGLEIVGAVRRNPNANVHRKSSPALSVAEATY